MQDKPPASWGEFWTLFHRRWGSDKASPEYVKREWGRMQVFLEAVQRGDINAGRHGYQHEDAR